jgi:hypothetical protein
MTVYVDHLTFHAHKRKRYAHMVADSVEELHAFAESVGINRCWFHKDHYDLNPKNHESALGSGAQLVEARTIVLVKRRVRDEATKRNGS